jgi:hypothetical protein
MVDVEGSDAKISEGEIGDGIAYGVFGQGDGRDIKRVSAFHQKFQIILRRRMQRLV